MAIVETISVPCAPKGSPGMTVNRHDDATVTFTDTDGTARTCALTLANLQKLFVALRESGQPKLAGITYV